MSLSNATSLTRQPSFQKLKKITQPLIVKKALQKYFKKYTISQRQTQQVEQEVTIPQECQTIDIKISIKVIKGDKTRREQLSSTVTPLKIYSKRNIITQASTNTQTDNQQNQLQSTPVKQQSAQNIQKVQMKDNNNQQTNIKQQNKLSKQQSKWEEFSLNDISSLEQTQPKRQSVKIKQYQITQSTNLNNLQKTIKYKPIQIQQIKKPKHSHQYHQAIQNITNTITNDQIKINTIKTTNINTNCIKNLNHTSKKLSLDNLNTSLNTSTKEIKNKKIFQQQCPYQKKSHKLQLTQYMNVQQIGIPENVFKKWKTEANFSLNS